MERHFLPAAGCCASWTVLFLRQKHRSIENTIPAAESVFRQKSPISRGGKPISSKFYRLPAARRRFSEDFSHFPPRETVFLRFFPISRRGKAFFERFSPFPAAGRRFSEVLIGFPRREGDFGSPRSVSRLILAFQKSRDRSRVSFWRFEKALTPTGVRRKNNASREFLWESYDGQNVFGLYGAL